MRHKLLAIEGNIGAGKTTLSRKIAEDYGGKLILEQFADNPFLPKFYSDPEANAFPLELFFMAERYQQLQAAFRPDLFISFAVSDYMFTKSLIFARVTLSEQEYKLYSRLFNIINPQLPKPDLIVYLYKPIELLQQNIRARGRVYEQKISGDYLQKIQDTYLDHFRQSAQQAVLVIDTTDVDFIANKEDYQKLLSIIDQPYPPGLQFKSLI